MFNLVFLVKKYSFEKSSGAQGFDSEEIPTCLVESSNVITIFAFLVLWKEHLSSTCTPEEISEAERKLSTLIFYSLPLLQASKCVCHACAQLAQDSIGIYLCGNKLESSMPSRNPLHIAYHRRTHYLREKWSQHGISRVPLTLPRRNRTQDVLAASLDPDFLLLIR